MASDRPLADHRLIGGHDTTALVTAQGEVDWWCTPRPDSPPALWSILDDRGGIARWLDARPVSWDGPPAAPAIESVVSIAGYRVRLRDGLVKLGDVNYLVRLARPDDDTKRSGTIEHELGVGGFPHPELPIGTVPLGFPARLLVDRAEPSVVDETRRRTTIALEPDRWTGLAVAIGEGQLASFDDLVVELERAEARRALLLDELELPKRHPRRAREAMAVLEACTFGQSGAVVAAPTTSLPEAPGGTRQFDYRYCWLRDAALATSVASLLGNHRVAHRYIEFVIRWVDPRDGLQVPMVTVTGDPVPNEVDVAGVAGWRDSRPVRVGNGANEQLQFDAWGFVVEAVSVYIQTGGRLDDDMWALVCQVADAVSAHPEVPSSGIWEFREPARFVSGDIGRWIAVDRAIKLGRIFHPFHSRRAWKESRARLEAKILGAIDDDGRLPAAYGGDPERHDASTLMAVLFGLLDPSDPRAPLLVQRIVSELGSGPYLYRYEPRDDDGFIGQEGAFLPVSFWAVSALAMVGRSDEARDRMDEMCRRLPPLLAEEVDPASDALLGNTPLVWTHMEMARALYLLDSARIKERFGTVIHTMWRVGRYMRLRRRVNRVGKTADPTEEGRLP